MGSLFYRKMKLDFKIVLLTIKKVIVKDGINSEGQATTLPFKGAKD